MQAPRASKPPSRTLARDGSGRGVDSVAAEPDHFEAIARSHERCRALGVSRIDNPDHSAIPRPDLQVALERNRRLHHHAVPVMSMLSDQIARSESMVLLTDSVGTIIHAVGDDDFLDRADKVALRAGANWSEGAKGTNAIGTALVNETPTLVHADEHYLHANQFLTCSAAPVLDPRGNVLGVLDVSGDFRSYHRHTLALVRMSARMIENRWLTEDFGHVMRLHFHSRPEFIGTLMEGILAIGEDGQIVGANRGALEHLGMSGAALRACTLQALFGTTLAELADRSRERVAAPLALHTADGRPYAGFVRCNWLTWGAAPTGTSITASVPARLGPADATTLKLPSARSVPATFATAPMVESAGDRPAPSTIEAKRLEKTRATPERDRSSRHAGPTFAQFCTGDPQLEAVVERLRRVVDRDIPILLGGETGTGKRWLARAIHAGSTRAHGAFVDLRCAAGAQDLLEAELFGSAAGGREGLPGGIERAQGGTLFLDEVGDLPLPLQARLLRVLQERQVAGPGGARPEPVALSVVCATRRDLRLAVESGTFRADLYHHLNGLTVRLPALRERSDRLALAQRLLDVEAPPRRALSFEVQALFESHGWPGNVRQLANVLRAACAVADDKATIERTHLPVDFLEEAEAPARPSANAEPVAGPGGRLEDLEIALMRRTLEAAGGNISEASKRLGISRNTIYRKLRWKPAS
jgi:transcriptional regulator of acetoin/glycerol metabolism